MTVHRRCRRGRSGRAVFLGVFWFVIQGVVIDETLCVSKGVVGRAGAVVMG